MTKYLPTTPERFSQKLSKSRLASRTFLSHLPTKTSKGKDVKMPPSTSSKAF